MHMGHTQVQRLIKRGNSPLMTSVFPLRLDWEFSLLPGSAILVLGTDAEMKRETKAH